MIPFPSNSYGHWLSLVRALWDLSEFYLLAQGQPFLYEQYLIGLTPQEAVDQFKAILAKSE